MQNIRSKRTEPEILLAKELKRLNIKFSQYLKSLPGKPDFVLRQLKIVIFVDSDFWHGHPKRFIMPKSNLDYWTNKIEKNKLRDKEVNRQLKKLGWRVIRIWEYDLKHNLNKSLKKITSRLLLPH